MTVLFGFCICFWFCIYGIEITLYDLCNVMFMFAYLGIYTGIDLFYGWPNGIGLFVFVDVYIALFH